MNNNIMYFNLNKKDDNAVVKLLHSGVKTIEKVPIHFTEIEGKKKTVKCCGNGCPMCARGISVSDRIFIHLFDYTDNTEKVWSRTDKILPQLEEIEKSGWALNDCVLSITRLSDDFPKYSVTNVNPAKYQNVNIPIDEKIAYRFYLSRSAEEMNEYYSTGTLPAHKSTFVPKEQYFKTKNASPAQPAEEVKPVGVSVEVHTVKPTVKPVEYDDLPFTMGDDPFADPFMATKRFN